MIENFSFDTLFCCKLRLSTKERSKDKVNLTNSNYNLYIEALWTIRDSKLINKASLWKSDDDWVLEPRESLFTIKNVSKNKVLTPTVNGGLIFEEFSERKPEQLWIKESPDESDYFTLKSNESFKYLTAISGNRLEVKGNDNKIYLLFR